MPQQQMRQQEDLEQEHIYINMREKENNVCIAEERKRERNNGCDTFSYRYRVAGEGMGSLLNVQEQKRQMLAKMLPTVHKCIVSNSHDTKRKATRTPQKKRNGWDLECNENAYKNANGKVGSKQAPYGIWSKCGIRRIGMKRGGKGCWQNVASCWGGVRSSHCWHRC